MHRKGCYWGRGCSVEDNEVQPQHTCTSSPDSQGSGAAKAPMHRLTSRSVVSSARPGTGLVVLCHRPLALPYLTVYLRLPSKNNNEK